MPTFPQSRRMKSPAAFDRAYARRKSASDGVLVVYAVETDLPHPRLGCSVSKKVGGAVVRNRYKRLFREAFRLEQANLPAGVDFVLIPRPGGPPTIDLWDLKPGSKNGGEFQPISTAGTVG